MKIKFIGTGNLASENRSSSSVLINDNILFDCGYGTFLQLKKMNIDIEKIKYIVISHFHGDHLSDITAFLMRRQIKNNLAERLVIIGYKGVLEQIVNLMNLLFGDNRGTNRWNNIEDSLNIEFVELDNASYNFDDFKIQSHNVIHGGYPNCNGYVISNNNISLGFVGDAIICDGVKNIINESDYIFLDATNTEQLKNIHLGFNQILDIANNNLDKVFYALHRDDYETKTIDNVVLPMDGDEYEI